MTHRSARLVAVAAVLGAIVLAAGAVIVGMPSILDLSVSDPDVTRPLDNEPIGPAQNAKLPPFDPDEVWSNLGRAGDDNSPETPVVPTGESGPGPDEDAQRVNGRLAYLGRLVIMGEPRAVLKVDADQYIVAPGEVIDEFELVGVERGSISVRFRGKIYSVERSEPTLAVATRAVAPSAAGSPPGLSVSPLAPPPEDADARRARLLEEREKRMEEAARKRRGEDN